MRRASIPALARVAHRLGVDADWVVFGHVHRCGPLAGDDPRAGAGPAGSPRVANTGSWVYEPLLVNHVTPPHPYWPGGAILLDDAGEPEPISLLNHLDAATLHGRPAGRDSVRELEDDLAGGATLVDELQRLGGPLEREALADDRGHEARVGQAV